VPLAAQRLASLQLPGVRLGAMPAEPVRRLPTGIGDLDDLIGGGLPRGHVSEIVGGPSSGRTAVLHALLASATRRGEVAAVVDLPDALDPLSLARAGADLERVLWVRPPSPQTALKCAELILSAGGFGLVAVDTQAPRVARPLPRHVWPRLAQVTRRAGAACVVCAPRHIASGVAAIALSLTTRRARWNGRLFEGITATAVLTRSRFGPAGQAISCQLSAVSLVAGGIAYERFQALDGVGKKPPAGAANVRPHQEFSGTRAIRFDELDAPRRHIHSGEHRRGLWTQR
jgi:hypothetical protein